MKLIMWTLLFVVGTVLASSPRSAADPGKGPTVQAAGTPSVPTQVNDFDANNYQVQVAVTFTNAPQYAKITCSIKDPINNTWVAGQLGNNGGPTYSVTASAGGTVFYYLVAKNSAWGQWIAGDGATVVWAGMWDSSFETLLAASDFYDAYLN